MLGISNIDLFKVFFDVVHEDTGDIEFQVFSDKIICSLLDKSHTNFYEVEFKEEFFSIFEVEDVESFVIDVDDLYKLLKSLKKSDELLLEVNDFYLIATVTSTNGNRRVFEYGLIDDNQTPPSFPSIGFETEFEVDTSDLKQSVTDLKLIGTGLYKMGVSGDRLFISTNSDARTNYSHEIDIDPEIPTKLIVSRFNVDFISKMLKFNKLNNIVEIRFGADKPLSYHFNGENIFVKGLIAPRFEED